MKNMVSICIQEFMKALKEKNIEVSKIQYKKCLERIQLFFFHYPEYDNERSPKDYIEDFQSDLTQTIEDACFEYIGIKNRDSLFQIADVVSEAFMQQFECDEDEEWNEKTNLNVDTIFMLQQYEQELKEKGMDISLVLEFPHIYKMATQQDEKALRYIKIMNERH